MNSGCTPPKVVMFLLVVVQLACGGAGGGETIKFPTATPPVTQTSVVVQVTQEATVVVRQTVVVQVTPTPSTMCVTADEAVYLRPAPNANEYPINPLEKGTKVLLTGGKIGIWVFVESAVTSGWINSKYIGDCE